MRAATVLAVAVGLGLALGLLLTGAGSGSSGFGGQLAILVIIAAGVYIGWLVAQLASATLVSVLRSNGGVRPLTTRASRSLAPR